MEATYRNICNIDNETLLKNRLADITFIHFLEFLNRTNALKYWDLFKLSMMICTIYCHV